MCLFFVGGITLDIDEMKSWILAVHVENSPEVKETELHQLQFNSLLRIRLFKDSAEYLQKWMEGQDT